MSPNVIPGILKNAFITKTNSPITVQITNLKEIVNDTGKRLRFILNDGEYSCHAVCRPEDSAKIEAIGIQKSSIIELTSYTTELMGSNEKKKHILVISDAKMILQTYHRVGAGKSVSVDEYFKTNPIDVGAKKEQSDAVATSAAAPSTSFAASASASPAPAASRNANKPQHLFAIDQLSPYQNQWTIKARVTYKSPMRTWTNQRGQGKLFNVHFLDETNEIRGTAFNETADQFYDVLQEGKVFYISKARIVPAKPQFSTLKHPYELSLDRDTSIQECEDAQDVPQLKYNFVSLDKIQDLEANSFIDVIGVIKEILPLVQITSKTTGKPYDRRDIILVDESQCAVNLGLWNKMAADFSHPLNSVLAVKNAKVQDFGGRSLTLPQSGTISVNPDIPEAFKLKGWYDTQGQDKDFKKLKQEGGSSKGAFKLEDRKTIQQVTDAHLGENGKVDYFSTKLAVSFTKTDNFSYPACSNEGCNRKVIEQGDGTWRCEKCDTNHSAPNYRYVLTCSLVDHTGQIWVTFFDDSATTILGVTANELMKIKENDMGSEFTAVMDKILMKEFNLTLSAREDNYNGTSRIRYQVQNAYPVDYSAECDDLVASLDSLLR